MVVQKERQGSTVTFNVSGELDTLSAPELEKAMAPELETADKVVLDLTDLQYISSSGIRVLLGAHKKLMGRGEMIILNPRAEIMEVFELTGLADVFDIRR